jgi:hypothetical protein
MEVPIAPALAGHGDLTAPNDHNGGRQSDNGAGRASHQKDDEGDFLHKTGLLDN